MHIHGFPPARFIISRLLLHSRLCRFVTIQHPSYKLRFFPNAMSAAMFCDPSYSAKDETVLKQILRPGDTFVDVGANVGTLSLYASALVGRHGQVLSFEAHPRTGQYLADNASLNQAENIKIYAGKAVGDTAKDVFFSNRGRTDDQNSISDAGVRVPMIRLDDIVLGHVRLLKIDVEGYELFVLRGAESLLAKTDFVYFESWESHFQKNGYDTQDVIKFLVSHGFKIDVPNSYLSRNCENLLAYR